MITTMVRFPWGFQGMIQGRWMLQTNLDYFDILIPRDFIEVRRNHRGLKFGDLSIIFPVPSD